MKNAFYFTLKSSFRFFRFFFFFDHLGKRLDKIYDVIHWETNNYNTHIVQYLKN